MLIQIKCEYGCTAFLARPVNKVWQKRFAKHMQEMTGEYTSCVCFQAEYELPAPIQHHRGYKELLKGYSIIVRIDPWIYGHWLGYDAHTVIG